MEAKGVFFVARRQYFTERFGADRWSSFIEHMGVVDPVFRLPILATTRVPIASYLRFQEQSLTTFFRGDEKAYWEMGEQSGEWALTVGPYKHFRQNQREFVDFVGKSLPQIWSNYFTEGELITQVQGTVAEGRIVNLPIWHVSFEYAVMGFMRRALELSRGPIRSQTRLAGVSAGDRAIHYRFELAR